MEFDATFFEDASKEWRRNKKAVVGGGFTYCCTYIHSTGKPCRKPVANHANQERLNYLHPEWRRDVGSIGDIFCRRHSHRTRVKISEKSGES
jgi:hypothetical protein